MSTGVLSPHCACILCLLFPVTAAGGGDLSVALNQAKRPCPAALGCPQRSALLFLLYHKSFPLPGLLSLTLFTSSKKILPCHATFLSSYFSLLYVKMFLRVFCPCCYQFLAMKLLCTQITNDCRLLIPVSFQPCQIRKP